MKADDFRRIALGMEKVMESAHMGHPDFRANGKIFATIHHDHKSGMVKLTPEQQQRFVQEAPEAFVPEAGAWGRSGSTRVVFAKADQDMIGEAMTLAWQNTAKAAKVRNSSSISLNQKHKDTKAQRHKGGRTKWNP
jgi:hypothetical protein